VKFRRVPIMVVKAIQFTGTLKSKDEIDQWSNGAVQGWSGHSEKEVCYDLGIKNFTGTVRADPGDWIIRGVNGDYYVCNPDIFEKSYEKVEE
jgi:hypothetical protein